MKVDLKPKGNVLPISALNPGQTFTRGALAYVVCFEASGAEGVQCLRFDGGLLHRFRDDELVEARPMKVVDDEEACG